MTPAARVQSAIEILDQVIEAAHGNGAPADRILTDWFRTHRFAGSKDKRAIRELVYDVIRAIGPIPRSGRDAMVVYGHASPDREHIIRLFDGSSYGPAPIEPGTYLAEPGIAPGWLVERLAGSSIAGDEARALLERAPLDLRVNTLKASSDTIALPESGEPLLAPNALRFPTGTPVEQWPAYAQGLVEVQDHGSQWACTAVSARPGETVIDLCAGAGGKTLALAAAMDNRGVLIASDTDKRRLGNLPPRAERAGAAMIETLLLDPGKESEGLEAYRGKADAVLVDAPCSGTGTWRRNPEARWRLDPAQIERYAAMQARLLDVAATLVKPGGRLVYVTCSLLDTEGRERIAAFLAANPQWTAHSLDMPIGRRHGGGTRLTPFHDHTDGFFIARLDLAC